MTKQTIKVLPKFASKQYERAFWESQDSVGFVGLTRAKNFRLPNLKPSTKAISFRLSI